MGTVQTERKDDVLTVRLNRPEIHNAFNPGMIEELTRVFRDAAKDKDLSAIILRGEGKSFCSGADLEWMKSMVDYTYEQNQADSIQLFEMFEAIYECYVPVLARVHGNVMGGGLGLVAACDIVSADRETRFCFSETRLGLVPAVISPFVLKKVSEPAVRELFLTAEIFRGPEAKEIGLIHFCGEPEEAEDYLVSKVDFLRGNSRQALRSAKDLLKQLPDLSWGEKKEVTTRLIAELRVSKEGQEGLKAFLEKRKPSWKTN